MRARLSLAALAFLLAAAATSSSAHVLLDSEIARPLLAEIVKHLEEARDSPGEDARLEALYRLGEKVHQLVELINLDVLGHGESASARLLVSRLAQYGIRIAFVERTRRYVSDLAPFEQYLRTAPRGPRSADAMFRLIAEAFYRSVGTRPGDLAEGSLETLRDAVANAERFLEQHPTHPKVREVRFFRAVDYYRLSRHSADAGAVANYRERARAALRQLVKDYPGSPEARTAAIVLKELEGDG
jgi:hypothetical protein